MKRLEINNKKCIRCGDCVKVCAEEHFKTRKEAYSAIKVYDVINNWPRIDVCEQCGDCARACELNAISLNELGSYVIDSTKCVGCLDCVEVCKHNGMTYVKYGVMPFKCDLCGKCVPVCPTHAIKLVEIEDDTVDNNEITNAENKK